MRRIILAFFNSMRGMGWAIRHEKAVMEEFILLAVAVPLAVTLATSVMMFVALIGAMLFLIAVELLNTAIEKLADHITRDHHPQIGLVKDLGSAAVFIALAMNVLVWGAALWLRL
jgi:diacylglycerol kinase (ATP)